MPIRLKPSQLPESMRAQVPKRQPKVKSDPQLFIRLCVEAGLPTPKPEHPFAKDIGRKWRFDWFFQFARHPLQVALEIQGGIFTQGRHVRGAALLKEMEKLNEAACRGIRVLFCTPKQFSSGEVIPLILRAMEIANGDDDANKT